MITTNNPLNLRYSAHNRWLGQLPPKAGFCSFETMQLGFRAALLTIRTYMIHHRRNTIEAIISHWAPPEDNNDTDHYIRWVCHRTAIAGRQVLSWGDPRIREIVWAMALIESGTDILTYRDDLDEAWRLLEIELQFRPS